MNDPRPAFLAHVRQDPEETWYEHPLIEHLQGVAVLSANFAQEFGNADWAELAGLWHDLGKYSGNFQKYIKAASGYDPEAHLEGKPGRVNHSSAGAIYAVERFGAYGRVLAYLIAGHHAGLADWYEAGVGGRALSQRLNDRILLQEVLSESPPKSILDQNRPVSKPPGGSPALWLRMLFSCLVDADFLDTEAFMQEKKAGVRSGYPPLTDLLSRFDQFMEVNFSQAQPTSVNKNRAKILQQCREKAYLSPGIFSLTVPTGGGKTLSGMAFALGHALSHGKNRIIYVIPYTSIIEQTVGIFRSIFGEAVIEHHSSLDPEQETQKSRLACENWDAPIIVTTNVQFFESLFTARTSRIRKLHNMVQSVVVLDEAQLLPPEFLKPIVNVIQDLVDHYGLTLVLSTATQPALKELNEVKNSIPQLKNVRELMDKPEELYSSLQRVKVEIPENLHVGKSWGQVAKELKEHPTVLCVVNRRADCQELFRLMPEGTFHLSGLMCGEHRSQTIDGIKLNLKKNQTVRVISTQLVEAGVDLDFPVVFRALAGLDSIAQAAGRCNREGKLNRGIVKIFVPDKPAPVGLLRKGEQTARQLLQQPDIELQGLEVFQKYFELFYAKVNDFDKHGILKDLDSGPKLEIQFRTAASKFKLIDEKNQAPVIVRYQNSNKWIECLRVTGPDRGLMRKLQRYVVTIPKPLHEKLKVQGDIEEIHPGIFVQTFHALYHPKLGFLGDRDLYHDPKDYVI